MTRRTMPSRRTFLRLLALAPIARLAPRPRLVCYGDSITTGHGASTPAHAYAALVAAAMGYTLDNRGIDGSRIVEQLQIIAPVHPPDVALLLSGYNDMRNGTELAIYRARLVRAASRLTSAGATLYLGDCLRMTEAGYAAYAPSGNHGSEQIVADMNAIIRTMPARIVRASAAYDPMNVDSGLVHPNDEGHAQIAGAFLKAMRHRIYLPIG